MKTASVKRHKGDARRLFHCRGLHAGHQRGAFYGVAQMTFCGSRISSEMSSYCRAS
jgi:hypothetical protein